MKEKLQTAVKYLSGMNLAYILVLAIIAKAIVQDVSVNTVLLTVPILSYEAYKLFLKSKKPDPVVLDEEVRKELDGVKNKLSALTMDKNVQPVKTRYF